MYRTALQINTAIQKAENIVLVPHPNPDGDALGSVAAFMQYLRTIGKNHMAFCITMVTPKLKFLPHADYITSDEKLWHSLNPDLIIVFDSGDLRYAGIEHLVKKSKATIINFDHHATNEYFGKHNMVSTQASSTTEMLYYYFSYNKIDIDPDMATCLLTGLMTDTDNFTNGATTSDSMSIASKLIHRGGNANLIRGSIFKDKSVKTLKLWGVVLSRLEKHEELDIVHTYVTLKDLQDFNVLEEETEGLANFMNNLKDGRATIMLKEIPGNKIKGSFRTTYDHTDVSLWAKALGGGGHKKAAGFTVDGPVDVAIKFVLTTIKNL